MQKKTYPYKIDSFTKYSDPWIRILAFVLDLGFIILITYNCYEFLLDYLDLGPKKISNTSILEDGVVFFSDNSHLLYIIFPVLPFFFLVWFLYFLGAESILARNSPAKLILGMQICDMEGKRPGPWRNFKRNVLKMLFFLVPAVILSFIDNQPLFYSILLLYFGIMVFGLIGWLSGSSAQHWMDKVVRTVVVQRVI